MSIESALPLSLIDATHFPHPEGRHLEFKRSFNPAGSVKYRATLCALLNTGGGHLLFGVEDDGRITGVSNSNAAIDSIKLFADNTVHLICRTDGSCVHPQALTVIVIPTKITGKAVVAIACTPSPGKPGNVYQFLTGETYHRLNASNTKLLGRRLYTQDEMDHLRAISVQGDNAVATGARINEMRVRHTATIDAMQRQHQQQMREAAAKHSIHRMQAVLTIQRRCHSCIQHSFTAAGIAAVTIAIPYLFHALF